MKSLPPSPPISTDRIHTSVCSVPSVHKKRGNRYICPEKVSGLLSILMSVIGGACFGCVSTDAPSIGGEAPAGTRVTKELYEAMQASDIGDRARLYDTSIPWRDTFLPPSDSYEVCAHHAIPIDGLDYRLFLNALRLCERRHPDEVQN